MKNDVVLQRLLACSDTAKFSSSRSRMPASGMRCGGSDPGLASFLRTYDLLQLFVQTAFQATARDIRTGRGGSGRTFEQHVLLRGQIDSHMHWC